ncbi:HtaA domain-containing protein [Georgenia sp. EYE_87]|uniref:HtaA domain-containing protein n=1 Tax=Georgenia sp. EYE_87 TaxID=2853448 RepID=UPI002005A128|nr:HtaA domain-containing protein [Georgenia sp. EYE_87]MCK6212292.1 HtaA domain-containing protein [Georgenia sp. EYE_87]
MTTTAGLAWAVKDSLVSYVEALADGVVEALPPASRSEAGFWFPLTDAGGSGVVPLEGALQFRGAIRLSGHWGALDVELRDPHVELDGRRGTLLIRDRGSRDPAAMLPFADLTLAEEAGDDGGAAPVEVAASLTGHGRLLLGGQYAVGEPLSPLRITLPPRHG